jgi:hypothetical protein
MSLSVNARESAGGADERPRSENQLPCPNSGFAHAYRRISEADAEDAIEIRWIDEARAARDVGHLERAARGLSQQPVRLKETPFENVLIKRLGRLFEKTVNLPPRYAKCEPDSRCGETGARGP